MPVYDQIIARTNVPIPDAQVAEILKLTPDTSVVARFAKSARLSTKVTKQTVLSTLPTAYWLNSDTGLKQTTSAAWENVSITAEELAVLLPIPNSLVDDTSIPLWNEVKPLLAEAIAVKVDNACLYGNDKPASFPTAILTGAVAAGNVVSPTTDLMVDLANVGLAIAQDGFDLDGWITGRGYNWRLRAARDGNGRPVYDGDGKTLYGYGIGESKWFPNSAARLLGVDWSAHTLGIRQDMTFDLFDQMVISDDAGKVIFNAAQQDSKVMRVVFRCGFARAIPVTRGEYGAQVNGGAGSFRFPAAVLALV